MLGNKTVILVSVIAALLATLAFHVAIASAEPSTPVVAKPIMPIPQSPSIIVEARTVTHYDANTGVCDLRYSTRDNAARLTVYRSKHDSRLVLASGLGLVRASMWNLDVGIDVELATGRLPCRNHKVIGHGSNMLLVVFYDYQNGG